MSIAASRSRARVTGSRMTTATPTRPTSTRRRRLGSRAGAPTAPTAPPIPSPATRWRRSSPACSICSSRTARPTPREVSVALIETMTFKLREGADETAFLAVDQRLQSDFAYQQPGIIRRTIAPGRGAHTGEWIVIDLWSQASHADACAQRWESDPLPGDFRAFVDRASVAARRYEDLPY